MTDTLALPSDSKNAPKIDYIDKIIGSFGKYQLYICVLLFITKFPVAFHQMAIIFLAPRMPYSCGGDSFNDLYTGTCPCNNPRYDTSTFTSTIISKWNLICKDRWLISFTQTLFQLGTLVGSIIFGMASDRFGRRKPMLVAVIMQISMGIAAAYASDYWTFTVIRLFVGASVGGTMVVGFVIVMEFVGAQYRDVMSALYQVPFNMGHLLLPLIGYFNRDDHKFQLAISIPTIIMLSYIFLLPETPRWLIATKRTDEAVKLLESVAKKNKLPTENIKSQVEAHQRLAENSNVQTGTILDLFRTPNLRKNTIAMAINWLSCSYCFYGVSQYVGQLSGNIFSNVAASAGVTIVGTLMSIPLMKVIGRRTILIVFNFLSVVCLLILAILPEGTGSVICACVGIVASFIIFVIVYLYCSELFPTVVRNVAVGFSSMMARVGSMVAPFVIDLRATALWIPPVVFALLPLIAGFAAFGLPETKGHELMTTIEEGEAFGKKKEKDLVLN